MLACLALTILVSLPDPMLQRVDHEWHSYKFCEPRSISNVPHASGDRSECEYVANEYLKWLQHAGVLPGAKEVISYRVTCTTEV